MIQEYGNYRVTVEADSDPMDPRDWDNFGTMVCLHNKYRLGDKHDLVKGDYNSWDEVRNEIQDRGGVLIFPLGLYDHSGISMYIGDSHDRWDGGQVGFIYCTKEDIEREGIDEAKAEEILKGEVKAYDRYLRGEVYQYRVEELLASCSCGECKSWEVLESCGGFDSEEDALKDAMQYLPKEAVA